MERYGQPNPPEFSIDSISSDIPIAMFVGRNDFVVNYEDNRKLRDQLKGLVSYEENDFSHMDFLMDNEMNYF